MQINQSSEVRCGMKIEETNGQNDIKDGIDVSGIFFTWSLPIKIQLCWLFMGLIAINKNGKNLVQKKSDHYLMNPLKNYDLQMNT